MASSAVPIFRSQFARSSAYSSRQFPLVNLINLISSKAKMKLFHSSSAPFLLLASSFVTAPISAQPVASSIAEIERRWFEGESEVRTTLPALNHARHF